MYYICKIQTVLINMIRNLAFLCTFRRVEIRVFAICVYCRVLFCILDTKIGVVFVNCARNSIGNCQNTPYELEYDAK